MGTSAPKHKLGFKQPRLWSIIAIFLFELQAVPQGPGLAVPRPENSVLLSPSVFQQSHNKSPPSAVPPAPSESSSSTTGVGTDPAKAPCSKTQLQETLIHLIKVGQGGKLLGWNTSKQKFYQCIILKCEHLKYSSSMNFFFFVENCSHSVWTLFCILLM